MIFPRLLRPGIICCVCAGGRAPRTPHGPGVGRDVGRQAGVRRLSPPGHSGTDQRRTVVIRARQVELRERRAHTSGDEIELAHRRIPRTGRSRRVESAGGVWVSARTAVPAEALGTERPDDGEG
jgi:hypothetical protein